MFEQTTFLKLPHITPSIAAKYTDSINQTFNKYQINTNQRQAAFLAQITWESQFFTHTRENLNYSAEGLLDTYKSHFDEATAQQYARNPEKIANRVYANRNGNGDEASGDGWKYIGRGVIQITGKENYANCGKALGQDFVTNYTLLENTPYSVLSAGWFWNSHALNTYADIGDISTITRKINGGESHYQDRLNLYNSYLKILGENNV